MLNSALAKMAFSSLCISAPRTAAHNRARSVLTMITALTEPHFVLKCFLIAFNTHCLSIYLTALSLCPPQSRKRRKGYFLSQQVYAEKFDWLELYKVASSRAVLESGDIWGLAQTSAGACGGHPLNYWNMMHFFFIFLWSKYFCITGVKMKTLLCLKSTWRSEVYSGVLKYTENTKRTHWKSGLFCIIFIKFLRFRKL